MKDRVRGWLPKESPSLSYQNFRKVDLNPKPHALSTRSLGLVAVCSLFLSFLLLALPYYIVPDWYIPKSSLAWGYRMPNTPEAWIILVTALFLLMLSVVTISLWGYRLKTAGSKWMKYT